MTQIICPISGLRMLEAPYMLGFTFKQTHPIFKTKRKDLVTDTLVHRFHFSKSEEERRLYFLGVLFSTDLVIFDTIAIPAEKTVEKYFQRSVELAFWIDYAAFQIPKGISLPRYIVRQENRDMENIGIWLSSVEKERESFISKNKDRELSRRLQARTQRLSAELSKAFLKDRFFTPWFVEWLLEVTNLEEHPQAETFSRYLLTKEKDAAFLDREILEEIKDLFCENFDMEHPLFAPVVGQFHRLLDANRAATGFEIVNEDVSEIDEDGIETISSKPVSLVYEARLLQETGSTKEPPKDAPLRAEFSSKAAFEEAKWKWHQKCAIWKLSQLGKVSPSTKPSSSSGEQSV